MIPGNTLSGSWNGRRVLITGHMGFKGAWLSALLAAGGAEVAGYGRDDRPDPLLFRLLASASILSVEGDVNDTARLTEFMAQQRPEVVFHLAAQPFVIDSYQDPLGTFRDNVMGTASVLQALRGAPSVRAAVIVTSDKVYLNREWDWAYREDDPLGGNDPYSASKAAAEILTQSMTRSYFSEAGSPRIVTVRAGNVIGGGDWGKNRLIPDAVAAFAAGNRLVIRNPTAYRPWQHVLDPLAGYMMLADALLKPEAPGFPAWNFGPDPSDVWPVARVADFAARTWGGGAGWIDAEADGPTPHESRLLGVDSSRVRRHLGWKPRWRTEAALQRTISWYRRHHEGADAAALVAEDIDAYFAQA